MFNSIGSWSIRNCQIFWQLPSVLYLTLALAESYFLKVALILDYIEYLFTNSLEKDKRHVSTFPVQVLVLVPLLVLVVVPYLFLVLVPYQILWLWKSTILTLSEPNLFWKICANRNMWERFQRHWRTLAGLKTKQMKLLAKDDDYKTFICLVQTHVNVAKLTLNPFNFYLCLSSCELFQSW